MLIQKQLSKQTILNSELKFVILGKVMRELFVICARLLNQFKFKYQPVFSARFDKEDEKNQVLDETEKFNNLNINHKLIETDINNIDVKSQLEHQIQFQETKASGWKFDKINSMAMSFYKTCEMNGRSFVKNALRSAAILNTENDDKFCFICSILAELHHCNNNHPNRVSHYRQFFKELNIEGFDFINGVKCSDVRRFIELINLSVNIFEINLYQDGDKWNHRLISIKISKNKSNKIIYLIIYNNMVSLKNYFFIFGESQL